MNRKDIDDLIKELLPLKYNNIKQGSWSAHVSNNFDPPWMCIPSDHITGASSDIGFALNVGYRKSVPAKMYHHFFVMKVYFEDLFPLYTKKDEVFSVLSVSRWIDVEKKLPEPYYGFTIYYDKDSSARLTSSYYSTNNKDPMNFMLKGVGTLIEDRIPFEQGMDPFFLRKIDSIFNAVSEFGLNQ